MQPSEALIQKFLKRECTPEEAEQVYRYLSDNPEILDKFISEQEWKSFVSYRHPDEQRSKKILQHILKNIDAPEPAKTFRINRWALISVAASVCVFLTVLFFTLNKPIQVANNTTPVLVKAKTINWQNTTNNTAKHLMVMLDDGSRVALAPKSTIRYTLPFKSKYRNIYLSGEAKFYVAKDKTRPFTVYSGTVATTALGTVFNIVCWPKANITTVKLLSGKVRVVNTSTLFKPVYLTPGKQLVFNNATQQVDVGYYAVNKPVAPVLKGTVIQAGDTLRFSNQPLPAVFSKLQELYHVQILTNGADLKKYYFTGEFNTRADSLPNVLNTISVLNKLQIIKTDSIYTILPISKKH
jgi:transmembrane sensor